VIEHWDDLLRIAGSLKRGWLTASLLLSRLQASRQNVLTKALQEYGRIQKTLFVLRYLESPMYRRSIRRQLNKGESLHDLRRFLCFADEGKIRRRHHDDRQNQGSCLNLVTNAVITWNTIYIAAAVERLRAEGHAIADEELAHVAPMMFKHVNPYGKYTFDPQHVPASRTELRPLRTPKIAA
jgi:TnpA family transposase